MSQPATISVDQILALARRLKPEPDGKRVVVWPMHPSVDPASLPPSITVRPLPDFHDDLRERLLDRLVRGGFGLDPVPLRPVRRPIRHPGEAAVKIQNIQREGGGKSHFFYCPACRELHAYHTGMPAGKPNWVYNGDPQRPTFTPSLLLFTSRPNKGVPDDPDYTMRPQDWHRVTLCHLFLTDGVIEYCGDCPHEMRGKKVPLGDIPADSLIKDAEGNPL